MIFLVMYVNILSLSLTVTGCSLCK